MDGAGQTGEEFEQKFAKDTKKKNPRKSSFAKVTKDRYVAAFVCGGYTA